MAEFCKTARARPERWEMDTALQAWKNIQGHSPESDENDGGESHVGEKSPPTARLTEDAAEKQQGPNLGKAQSSRWEEVKDKIQLTQTLAQMRRA